METPPNTRPSPVQKTIAVTAMIFAVTGLTITLYYILADDHWNSRHKALLLAAFSFLLGILTVWVSLLWKETKLKGFDVSHFSHELGMAFIVSFVVVSIIDITLHVQAEREADHHFEQVKELTNSHGIQIDKTNEANLQAIKKMTASFLTDMKKEHQVTQDLQTILNMISAEQPDASIYEPSFEAFARIKKNSPHPQLSLWHTVALDKYGLLLLESGNYSLAKTIFEKALEIDRELRSLKSDYKHQMHVAITHERLAKTNFLLPNYKEADQHRNKAIEQYRKLLLEYPLSEEIPVRIDATFVWRDYVENGAWPTIDGEQRAGKPIPITLKEKDWATFKIRLEEKAKYQISAVALSESVDPFLILRKADRDPAWVKYDDDSGGYPDAVINHDVLETGEYWITVTTAPRAAKERSQKHGKMELKVKEAR